MRVYFKILLALSLVAGGSHGFATATMATTINRREVEDRHLSGFNGVSLESSFDVYITQGTTESVKVEADADEMGRVITEVKNGILKIRNKNSNGISWSWGNKKHIVYITTRDINKISISGSGDVYFKTGIRTPDLAISLSGSGDVSGQIEVKTVKVSVSGSGDIKLTGRAESSSVEMSGSGDYSGRALVTVRSAVSVSGSGDVSVNATQQLDASVSGSGDIHYTGGAKIVNLQEHGSGDISRI